MARHRLWTAGDEQSKSGGCTAFWKRGERARRGEGGSKVIDASRGAPQWLLCHRARKPSTCSPTGPGPWDPIYHHGHVRKQHGYKENEVSSSHKQIRRIGTVRDIKINTNTSNLRVTNIIGSAGHTYSVICIDLVLTLTRQMCASFLCKGTQSWKD